jgi:hypothetical protein
VTKCGPLDVLGAIGRGLAYEDLLPNSTTLEIGSGLRVQVLDLPMLIALKEELAGEKDIATLPVLRRTLEQQERASNS